MSGGFRAHPEHLGAGARKAHEHADRVEHHSRALDSATQGKVLGRGKFGKLVEKAVRPVVDSMIKDMSKAMAGTHRSLGHGLEITKKNLDEAEKAVREGLKGDRTSLNKHGIKLGDGQSIPGREALQHQYDKQVRERVDELAKQGHGPGRHLRVSDDQLKARLGKPFQERRRRPQETVRDDRGRPVRQPAQYEMVWDRNENGFLNSRDKIDPLHGPEGPNRPEAVRYDDYEKVDQYGNPKKHTCDNYSTAFKDEEAYMYAELRARQKIDLGEGPPHPARLTPEEAWGPGDHRDKFKGYYLDPTNPMGPTGPNYRNVNFEGASIEAWYYPDGKGGYTLATMFPKPDHAHNPVS
ncbi:hypothetical protein CFP65_3845 [Kitasatospora sp. MMS16-BH015]|uniref:hypothetical protein n=1 Tax=Kitasatospora sp. MMS16-BH015 TaxID=2018025 RepID=UPI000CA24EE7|nr:hypothetical protein [Kitasatospora sp. MMS16-BH015]AUG78625.1 hypothetical protein CFP65_3845 [Kitasatospora sp. MMS16-BH015]